MDPQKCCCLLMVSRKQEATGCNKQPPATETKISRFNNTKTSGAGCPIGWSLTFAREPCTGGVAKNLMSGHKLYRPSLQHKIRHIYLKAALKVIKARQLLDTEQLSAA